MKALFVCMMDARPTLIRSRSSLRAQQIAPRRDPRALVAAVDIRWLREPIRTTVAAICGWLPSALEHDREKCVAAFRRDHAQIKKRRGHHGGKRGRTASPLRARSRRTREG